MLSQVQHLGVWLVLLSAPSFAGIIYVDDDAPPGGNGQSWTTAFTFLRDALAVAQAGDEIRVAGGIYCPDRDTAHPLGTGDRDLSFDLVSGVGVYGGYAGLSLPSDPDLRDLDLYATVLSGNIGSPTNDRDNSRHIVKALDADVGTLLDGLTIREGHGTHGTSMPQENGLGIYASGGTLTLRQCSIADNVGGKNYNSMGDARTFGGGIYASQADLNLIECTLTGNVAGEGGELFRDFRDFGGVGGDAGAIYACEASTIRIVSSVLANNRAGAGGPGTHYAHGGDGGRGGAVFIATSSRVEAVNCVITGNRAGRGGGGGGSGGAGGDAGGIYVDETSSLNTVNCVLSANGAGNGGGGGWLYDAGGRGGNGAGIYVGASGHVAVVNCLIAGNRGGDGAYGYAGGGNGGSGAGLYTTSQNVRLIGCTITDNHAGQAGQGGAGGPDGEPGHGGALYCDDVVPNVDNCILWLATPELIVGLPEITYSDVQGGWTGIGNIAADPLFIDPDGPDNDPNTWADNDFRLAAGSPCIDAGDNLYPPRDEFDLDADGCVTELLPIDLDGHARYVDDPATPDTGHGAAPLVDMGAYEYPDSSGPPVGPCAGDVNCDGVIDFDDINAFVLALTDPVAYGAVYPDCFILSADIDNNGLVELDDIDWFVGLLSRGQQ